MASWSISFHVISHLAFSADGQRLAAVIADGTVHVWEIKSRKLLHTFHHGDRVTCVAFHPNGKQLASVSCDNTAKVWDLETGKELETLRGHSGFRSGVRSSEESKICRTLRRP